MATTKRNLVVQQGTTFSNTIVLKDSSNNDLDVTGYSANGMMRKHYDSTNSSATFTTSLSNGQVVISLDANTTTSIVAGRYVYDVELTDGDGAVTRWAEGNITVTPQATK